MDTVELPTAIVSRLAEDLVRIRIKEDADICAKDIYEISDAKNKLVNGRRNFVLFVPPDYGHISAEGRAASASPYVYYNAIAKAIIVKNVANRMIARFFINFNRPPAPTRIFDNEACALKWFESVRVGERADQN